MLWPSFQAAVAGKDERCVKHVCLSLYSSTLSFATVSKFLKGKFSVVHMQNGTLAEGVVMKVCGDMEMGLHGTIVLLRLRAHFHLCRKVPDADLLLHAVRL